MAQGNSKQSRKKQNDHPMHVISLRHDHPKQQLPDQIITMTMFYSHNNSPALIEFLDIKFMIILLSALSL